MTAKILTPDKREPADPLDLDAVTNTSGRAEWAEAARLEGRFTVPGGLLWTREAERSARFDEEGFDRFTEITAHAALAREAAERARVSTEGFPPTDHTRRSER